MCLANPPFKGSIDAESISDNLKAVTSTKKTELPCRTDVSTHMEKTTIEVAKTSGVI